MYRLILTEDVVANTLKTVRSYWKGRLPHEGPCFWLGVEYNGEAIVTTCVAPQAETSPGRFHVDAVDNARMIWAAAQHGLIVIGQVHSHPPRGGIRHSRGDDRDAFMPSEGFYSLVIPNYGVRNPAFSTWGVHVYERNTFRMLTAQEVQQQVVVVPNILDLRTSHDG